MRRELKKYKAHNEHKHEKVPLSFKHMVVLYRLYLISSVYQTCYAVSVRKCHQVASIAQPVNVTQSPKRLSVFTLTFCFLFKLDNTLHLDITLWSSDGVSQGNYQYILSVHFQCYFSPNLLNLNSSLYALNL